MAWNKHNFYSYEPPSISFSSWSSDFDYTNMISDFPCFVLYHTRNNRLHVKSKPPYMQVWTSGPRRISCSDPPSNMTSDLTLILPNRIMPSLSETRLGHTKMSQFDVIRQAGLELHFSAIPSLCQTGLYQAVYCYCYAGHLPVQSCIKNFKENRKFSESYPISR